MGYLHFAMHIVRVPGVQAFRITIVSLLANNCLPHELMMHDTFLPLPFLIQAPPVILACRILELYNAYTHGRLMVLWVRYCII